MTFRNKIRIKGGHSVQINYKAGKVLPQNKSPRKLELEPIPISGRINTETGDPIKSQIQELDLQHSHQAIHRKNLTNQMIIKPKLLAFDPNSSEDKKRNLPEIRYQEGSELYNHDSKYRASCKRIVQEYNDLDELKRIRTILQYQRIKCFKYNSSLYDDTAFFSATLQLSKDGKELILKNKRLIPRRKYVGTTDPKQVLVTTRDYIEGKRQVQERKRRHRLEALDTIFKEKNLRWSSDDKRIDEVEDISSSDEEVYNPDYKRDYNISKSFASCRISDIQSIVFGGFSSRFWLLRKHMNAVDTKVIQHKDRISFYAWDCLTIQLEHRDIDLIIRKESQMQMLLNYILNEIDSIDGIRGSRKLYHDTIYKKLRRQQSSVQKKSKLYQEVCHKSINHQLMKQTEFRYKILRIRSKLGFQALVRHQPVQQMFVSEILKAYDFRQAHGSLEPVVEKDQEHRQLIKYITGDRTTGTFLYIQHLNSRKKQSEEQIEICGKLEAIWKKRNPQQIEKEGAVANIWKRIKNKNDPEDILMNTKVDGKRIYQAVTDTRRVSMKSQRALLIKKYMNLNMIINLKALQKDDFCKCVLNKIEIIKTKFIIDIQLGADVFIPKELSMDGFPKSFRYYDPIFQICFDQVDDERKEYFHSKKLEKILAIKALATERLKVTLFHNKNPTFAQLPKRIYEIDAHVNPKSISTARTLQRSKYMKIDDGDDLGSGEENEIQLSLAYCKSKVVEQKNRRILWFKSQFVQKLKHLQNIGRANQLMLKLEAWLENDINDMYHLNNEQQYLNAVEVRGHQFILKDKARKYLLDKANVVIQNKMRRRRLKQTKYYQGNLINKYLEFENKTVNVDMSIRETYKYFSVTNAETAEIMRKAMAKLKHELRDQRKTRRSIFIEQCDDEESEMENSDEKLSNNQDDEINITPIEAFIMPCQKLRRASPKIRKQKNLQPQQKVKIVKQPVVIEQIIPNEKIIAEKQIDNRIANRIADLKCENELQQKQQEDEINNLRNLLEQQHDMIVNVYNQVNSRQNTRNNDIEEGKGQGRSISLDSIQFIDDFQPRPGLNDIGLVDDDNKLAKQKTQQTQQQHSPMKLKKERKINVTSPSIYNSSYFDNEEYDQPIIQPVRIKTSRTRSKFNSQGENLNNNKNQKETSLFILSPEEISLAQNEIITKQPKKENKMPNYYKIKQDDQNEPQEEMKFTGVPQRIKKEINTASQGLGIANNIVQQDNAIKQKIQEMDAFTTVQEYTQFKSNGIPPILMTNYIVAQSQLDDIEPQNLLTIEDLSSNEEEKEIKLDKIFLISHENNFLQFFKVIDISCCIVSSYTYAWISYFGNNSPTNSPYRLTVTFEIIFTLSILFKFVTTYIKEGETQPETSHKQIFLNYYQNEGLVSDIIGWLPNVVVIFLDCSKEKYFRIFYIIKCIRIVKAQEKFDVVTIMQHIKNLTKWNTLRVIEQDPMIGEDQIADHNKIGALIKTSFILRIIKLVVILVNMSYFVGFIFMISADALMHFAHELGDTDQEFFINYYEITDQSDARTTLIIIYFTFTSLSTTGFGDYNPRSDFERIFISFMIVSGVAIFSYIMQVFIEIMAKYETVTAEIDDYERLSRFFGVLVHYNKGKPIDNELKTRIEQFFTYKWANDNNQAIDDDEEKAMLEELPPFLQDKLYFGYLFTNFFNKFTHFFLLENHEARGGDGHMCIFQVSDQKFKKYYDMQNQNFRNFIIEIVQNLEPQKLEAGFILVNEMAEVGEINFVHTGNVGVGYELNKFKKLILQFNDKCVIGDFYTTFNQRANFIYCSTTEIQSYFIRRQVWLEILDNNESLKPIIQKNILYKYILRIKSRLLRRKHQDVKKFIDRNDYHMIQISQNKEEHVLGKDKVIKEQKILEEPEDDDCNECMMKELEHVTMQIDVTSTCISQLMSGVQERLSIIHKQQVINNKKNDIIQQLKQHKNQ